MRFTCVRRLFLCGELLLTLGLTGVGQVPAPAVPTNTITWQPAKLVRGSPVLFRVRVPAGVKELSGKLLGHEVKFFAVPGNTGWYALAGIPVETAAGYYQLELTGIKGAGSF